MDTEFHPLRCVRCSEVICYSAGKLTLEELLKLSIAELWCWQCTQRSKTTTKIVTEIPLPPTISPSDGPRAA